MNVIGASGQPAVHSIERVVFSVPDLDVAERFYTAFGLEVNRHGQQLDLKTFGNSHCWMSVIANGQPKALQFLSFGIHQSDETTFSELVEQLNIGCEPAAMAENTTSKHGIWLRSPDGTPLQLLVTDKVSPSSKCTPHAKRSLARGTASAAMRSATSTVKPRTLSHVLIFTKSVQMMLNFCESTLGLRLSDRSGDLVAFMHTPHGSDHHLLAFVGSDRPGLHHTSWDVGSLDEVGEGSEQLRAAGYTEGWGVGRHVLGSNYFYYARDPWGSFAEYSFDIDFVAPDSGWIANDYPPEDSFYLWGPTVPEWFVNNNEVPSEIIC